MKQIGALSQRTYLHSMLRTVLMTSFLSGTCDKKDILYPVQVRGFSVTALWGQPHIGMLMNVKM